MGNLYSPLNWGFQEKPQQQVVVAPAKKTTTATTRKPAKKATVIAPIRVAETFKTEKLPILYDISNNPLSGNPTQIANHLNTIKVTDPLVSQTQTFDEAPVSKEGLTMNKAFKVANWINAANAVTAIGMGIYGMNQVNKMQTPDMVSAPVIEAKQIRDSGAQQMAARKSSIYQSANTTREALRRAGRTDLLPSVSAKEMSATNEAAAAIEGLRTNIEAQNVAAENRVSEINANSRFNADQFNSQIQNNFRQFQAQMKNSILNSTLSNVNSNISGIGANLYSMAAMRREDNYRNQVMRMAMLNGK